jgi:multimeric flavodoxin WrbA
MAKEKTVKITAVFSSPRKESNSTVLAREIIRGAIEGGADVKTFDLKEMTINACRACYACKKDDKGCIIQDGMQAIYPELIASQVWIMATPIYWFTVSAQLKLFIDRLFALYNQDSKKSHFQNKRIVAAMAYGCEDPFESGCGNAIRSFQDMASYTGSELVGYVHGCGDMAKEGNPAEDGYLVPGSVVTDTALMEKAFRLGKKLLPC